MLYSKLKFLSNQLKIPFIAIHSPQGYSLIKTHIPFHKHKDESRVNYVKAALNTKRPIKNIFETPIGITYIVSTPLFIKDKKIGIISLGQSFDNIFSYQLKDSLKMDIAFIWKKKLLGSTFEGIYQSHIIKNFNLYHHNNEVISFDLGNKSYETTFIRLSKNNNIKSVYLMIAIDASNEKNKFFDVIFILLIFTVVGIAISVYLSKVIQKKIVISQNNVDIVINTKKVDSICKKYGITEREKEILFLVLKNNSNSEISKKNYITLGTVKRHIHNIYQKIKVSNRSELIELFKN